MNKPLTAGIAEPLNEDLYRMLKTVAEALEARGPGGPGVFFPNFPVDEVEGGEREDERYVRIRRAALAIRARATEEGDASDEDVVNHTITGHDLGALLHYIADMHEM